MKSIENNFDEPQVNELLTKHFIELRSVSPEGSAHVLDIQGLKDPTIRFWSLWVSEELVGCGALKLLEKEHGEFKSIRVADEFRKKGIGERIINHLIEEAKKLEISKLSIETGSGAFFLPARNLFSKFGFKKSCNILFICSQNFISLFISFNSSRPAVNKDLEIIISSRSVSVVLTTASNNSITNFLTVGFANCFNITFLAKGRRRLHITRDFRSVLLLRHSSRPCYDLRPHQILCRSHP